MEISEIQKAHSVGQIQKKEAIASTKLADRLSISSEAEKKAQWVEMLKEMPDCVRSEKIEAAQHASPSSQQLAEKMLNHFNEI